MTKAGILNRDLSWLDFNNRVLDEAADPQNPLLDRLKFIAITSSNLNEFFMVRVAGLRQQSKSRTNITDPSGMTPYQQLSAIHHKVELSNRRQYRYLHQDILPELEKRQVFRIVNNNQLKVSELNVLRQYFKDEILPVLTPVAVDSSHPFPIIANGMIEIAVLLKRPQGKGWFRALVEVPKVLPRFIPIDKITSKGVKALIPVEELIIKFLDLLFTDCRIVAAFPFRLLRDMDFSADTDGIADLLQHMQKELKQRRLRQPIRLDLPTGCDRRLSDWLIRELNIEKMYVYRIPELLSLDNLFQLVEAENSPELREPEWPPLPSPLIAKDESMFEAITREGCIPLFLPYEQFDPVINLLEEAAEDPGVLAIKQTLYRVSGDSPVVQGLRRAAENGKQVTVIVEVKARFDEERNIGWARHLEEAGVHVIYGIVGLKIHCKALLIIRREESHIHRYLHVATGNYNDKTAKLYTDAGIFTINPDLCADVAALFNIMTGYSEAPFWNQVATAPFDLRDRFLSLIEREIRLTTPRRKGAITAKINSLVDPEIIQALLRAARAGVKINLVVRGICCLCPGELANNLHIVSIVDRFLEHTRMFRFYNGGKPEYFMSSADWMPRNLNRRFELLFPILDQRVCQIIDTLFELQLADKRKGRHMRPDGTYKPGSRARRWANTRSQLRTYQFFKNRLEETASREPALKKLQILRGSQT